LQDRPSRAGSLDLSQMRLARFCYRKPDVRSPTGSVPGTPFYRRAMVMAMRRAAWYDLPVIYLPYPLQKLLLGRGQLRDLESEVGGSAPKRVDLTLSMSRFIKLGTSIDELHPIPEHSIHEPSQFCCHSLDRYRRP